MILLFVTSCMLPCLAQEKFSAGIRVGEPSGISLRFRVKDTQVLELIAGKSALLFDFQKKAADTVDFLGYNFNPTGFGAGARYLFFHPLINYLKWYHGFGGIAIARDEHWNQPPFTRSSYNLMSEFVLGVQHDFSKLPLSLALDLSGYLELIDNPFVFHGGGGLTVLWSPGRKRNEIPVRELQQNLPD